VGFEIYVANSQFGVHLALFLGTWKKSAWERGWGSTRPTEVHLTTSCIHYTRTAPSAKDPQWCTDRSGVSAGR